MELTISVADLSDLFAALEEKAVEIVSETVNDLSSKLDRAAPRSGDNAGETLADTQVVTEVTFVGGVARAEIAYEAEYAQTTDTGRQGDYYPIVPVNARFLRFEGTNEWAGQTILTDYVNHPPQQGSRWFSDAFDGDIWVD